MTSYAVVGGYLGLTVCISLATELWLMQCIVLASAWRLIQNKDHILQYMNSHRGDETVLRPSYLHSGISYSGKTTSIYDIYLLDQALSLPWASVHWLLQCTLEWHWDAIGWSSVHWNTTGRPSEYLQGTLEHHWKNLVETAPHGNTAMPLEKLNRIDLSMIGIRCTILSSRQAYIHIINCI